MCIIGRELTLEAIEVLNKVILMGRLTRDPELRHTQSGTAVASFALAVDRSYKAAGNERQTDFIDCVAWGTRGDFVKKWFSKGMMAVVVGQLQTRRWEDKNGNKRVAVEVNVDEISFGETKKAREAAGNPPPEPYPYASDDQFVPMEEDESDVPF